MNMADGAITMPTESRRKRCERRLAQLRNERDGNGWISHWRELAEFFMPRRGRLTLGGTSDQYNKGDKRHTKIIDGTPISARETLSAGMMAGITSPARPWFRNTIADPVLREQQDVKTWLSDIDRDMLDVLARSNFYESAHAFYDEIGTFGSAVMLADEDGDNVVVFRTLTAGEFYFGLDSKGRVDTLYREFKMTVRQVVQEFKFENCSTAVQNQYQSGNLEAWIDIVHAIEPNEDQDKTKADKRGMPYRSIYYERAARTDLILREKGYRENPILAARWSVLGGDSYGTSPAMNALGDAKALQIQERRKALAIDKMVDPPLNVPVEMRNAGVASIPGGVNYYSQNAGPRPGITPAHEPNATVLGPLLQDEQELRDRVNRFMYADLFLMLANSDRRQITAREIDERHEEKLLMLGPVLERLNSEFLNRLIDRTFGIMLRKGLIAAAPEPLQGQTLKTEYISVLAQAQKQVALAGLDNFLARAGQVFAVNPSSMDKIDFDQIIDETGDMLGVSPRIIRSDDDVAAKREGEAQRAQMEQMAAMAKPMADVAGAATKLAGTPAPDESVMSKMAGNVAGAIPA